MASRLVRDGDLGGLGLVSIEEAGFGDGTRLGQMRVQAWTGRWMMALTLRGALVMGPDEGEGTGVKGSRWRQRRRRSCTAQSARWSGSAGTTREKG